MRCRITQYPKVSCLFCVLFCTSSVIKSFQNKSNIEACLRLLQVPQ